MSKRKKPMSLDEKKECIMGIFYSSGEVFNMKEIVKIGASSGVVENTVEDVVRTLVGERLVMDDKIGAGAFFWSFPSSTFLQTKARVGALEASLVEEGAALQALEAKHTALSADKAGVEERGKKLEELARLKAHRAALEAEVKAKADYDPTLAAELLAKVKKAKASADRWTDNITNLASHLVSKYNMDPKEAKAMLGMDDKFDYPA